MLAVATAGFDIVNDRTREHISRPPDGEQRRNKGWHLTKLGRMVQVDFVPI